MSENVSKKSVFPIKGTLILSAFLLPLFFISGLFETDAVEGSKEFHLMDLLSMISAQLLTVLLLVLAVKHYQADVKEMWRGFI